METSSNVEETMNASQEQAMSEEQPKTVKQEHIENVQVQSQDDLQGHVKDTEQAKLQEVVQENSMNAETSQPDNVQQEHSKEEQVQSQNVSQEHPKVKEEEQAMGDHPMDTEPTQAIKQADPLEQVNPQEHPKDVEQDKPKDVLQEHTTDSGQIASQDVQKPQDENGTPEETKAHEIPGTSSAIEDINKKIKQEVDAENLPQDTEDNKDFVHLYLGGIPLSFTKPTIIDYFRQYTEVKKVMFKNIWGAKQLRYGFLVCKFPEKILAIPEHKINGVKIDVKSASPAANKIMIRGTGNLTKEEICEYFTKYGNITLFQQPAQQKYCFLAFDTAEAASKCIATPQVTIGTTEVMVVRAQRARNVLHVYKRSRRPREQRPTRPRYQPYDYYRPIYHPPPPYSPPRYTEDDYYTFDNRSYDYQTYRQSSYGPWRRPY